MRAILVPAELPPSALAELKQWLGITTEYDDIPLTALLRAGLDICEAFTGLIPIEAGYEEVLARSSGWQTLASRPVQAITSLEALAADGTRTALDVDDHAIELDADGAGRFRVTAPGDESRIAVQFTAGLAPDWDSLPGALRHGIIRLAAHQHRERETSGPGPLPPAAIAALWRPWRRMRMA